MNDRTNTFPAQVLDTLAEVNGAPARHVAGQAAMVDPKIAHLVAMYKKANARGQAEIFACAARQMQFPREG